MAQRDYLMGQKNYLVLADWKKSCSSEGQLFIPKRLIREYIEFLASMVTHQKKGGFNYMFNTIKFLQALGASLLVTIIVSFIIGFIPINSINLFVFIQLLLTYGAMGYFAAKWNPQTPYTAAYLGALVIAVASFLLSHYVFNILVFTDPEGIARSLTFAVLTSLLAAYIYTVIRTRREGVLQ